jgi:predicted nucleic acid-binding protein
VILYLDTSALVKLFTDESGSDEARGAAVSADESASAVIAYAEARSALARALATRRMTRRDANAASRDLDALWPDLIKVIVDEELALRAGELASRHVLRGMDALHLAAALALAVDRRSDLSFASWDAGQRRAARREGLSLVPVGL